jgi:hypothetical protein
MMMTSSLSEPSSGVILEFFCLENNVALHLRGVLGVWTFFFFTIGIMHRRKVMEGRAKYSLFVPILPFLSLSGLPFFSWYKIILERAMIEYKTCIFCRNASYMFNVND